MRYRVAKPSILARQSLSCRQQYRAQQVRTPISVDQYAAYVWAAYAITGVGLAGLVGVSIAYTRRWRQRLVDLEQSQNSN
ncbi:MAG: heme exporter protein CcmD [Alphaproteobacteria bacterium]|nr:heme exporter protein CcmD [Alphaproteobacteria bacterium]MAS47211.1 heme exporter protein CcmD [Alphaproteobacteria bacterium]MAX95305.1 heme exporter protein CcmD [Alphaproteobacteria bacterium]MBN53241.1 heme exporter protein CcmD [Alphaproteobacteria bacterium]OUT41266.1 MAG: heme exporter protein CcmD [Micavibrio sp. TMED2]